MKSPPPPEPIREPVILSPAPEPTLKPIAPSRKKKPWFVIAACAAILFLGIGIGVRLGDGNTEPTVPTETVQLQKPLETTLSPEATVPPEIPLPLEITTPPEVRDANTLCSDEIPDDFDSSNYKYPVFGSSYLREQIRSVTFLDTLSDMPSDAWDVSEAGNGKVMAWVEPHGEMFDLYIGAEGGVWAGESCIDMFEGYIEASKIMFGSAFHTENVRNVSDMFWNCSSLTSLNLSSFDTTMVQNMSGMFSCCDSLTNLDLSTFNTSNVTDMGWMFPFCNNLTSLDLSNFDTINVQNMAHMFYSCESLTNLELGDRFVTTNADTSFMFDICPVGDNYQHLLH